MQIQTQAAKQMSMWFDDERHSIDQNTSITNTTKNNKSYLIPDNVLSAYGVEISRNAERAQIYFNPLCYHS